MEDLIRKYDELYEDMASAKDPNKMMAFGDAEKWMFHMLAKQHPELAEEWLDKLEIMKWNNYLSQEEAESIVESLVERHGDEYVQRHEWDYPTFKNAVESLGGKVSEEPYYNCWALWATMNMLYSDHQETVNAFIQVPHRVRFYYKLAVDKLKDFDKPKFVRKYFNVGDKDRP